MISQLQLKNYYVEELSVKTNPSFRRDSGTQRKEGKFHFEASVAASKEVENLFRLQISASVVPADESPSLDPYAINIKIVGFFEVSGDLPPDGVERLVSLNGSNVLLGLARGIVAQSTGTGQHGKYLLPLINLTEVIKQKTIEQSDAGNELEEAKG